MEILVEILKTVIWPATVIISVVVLRKGILELIPNMKKLKYKDLEVEFEKEAIKLRAIVERDIPHIELPEEKFIENSVSEPTEYYSVKTLSPSESVTRAWDRTEVEIISLMDRHNINIKLLNSVRAMIDKLSQEKIIDNATNNALLELCSYRNKIAHAQENLINHEMSDAFYDSSDRIINYLKSL
jgi:uncharacterized protein YutE (UPF0331/DUF86 family)